MGNAMKKIKSWFPGKKGADEEHEPLTEVETPPRKRAEPGSISPEDGRFAAEDLGNTGSDTDTDEALFTDNPLIL